VPTLDAPAADALRTSGAPPERAFDDLDAPAERSRAALTAGAQALWRRRRRIALAGLVGALVGVAAALARPPRYVSSFSFTPQGRAASGNLSGLAAQFGISVPTDQAQSPAFYVSLLQSDAVRRRVVATSFAVGQPGGAVRGTLVEFLRARGDTPAERLEDGVRRLGRALRASVQIRSGIVEVSVAMPAPDLSRQVAERLLALVDDYNQRQRVTQASAQRRFTEARLGSVATELRTAEERLEQFLRGNREFRGSPTLVFAEERLRREVEFRQQVYNQLAQSLEKAKIDEVRDTPVISVVDAPTLPVRPEPRNAVAAAVLGALVAGGLTAAAALWGAAAGRPRDRRPG
jgi:uncharacterized protein involved in exopolysaccharide biosynthesis